MKKLLSFSVLSIGAMFAASRASAQSTGNVTLNVQIQDIIALTVNTNTVTFNLNGTSSYSADQTQSLTGQFTVLATRPFDLDVKANSASLSAGGGNTLPLNVVKIESTNSNLGITPASAITLTNANQKLLDEANAGLAQSVDMKYTLLTNTNFSSFNVASGTYTTTLVYTASID
ncbi:hypothetical protein ACTHGU_14680 [Chitinophagaceae bacterium MMS25-I14]